MTLFFFLFQREEMLQKMNVWNYEKSIEDTDVTGKLMDETKEGLSDTKTELSPLTRTASNTDNSNSQSVNVQMSNSSRENGLG